MSSAQVTWQKEKTQRVFLRFNRVNDADILEYIQDSGAPLQLFRRLIRDEIARTGWTPSTAAPRPASLSLDGGKTWILPADLPLLASSIAARWDDITAAMDPHLYDATDADCSPCPLPEFVAHYLELAGKDLIV